jgi:hypothetical protein
MSGLLMKYFVLKPNGDDAYARAARAAMREYAKHIVTENLQLSDELWQWAQDQEAASRVRVEQTVPLKP